MAKKGKKKKDDLSRSQKIELALQIRELMADGETDVEIMDSLELKPQEFSVCKAFLLDMLGNEQEQMTSKQRFARYVIEQERNVKDLDDLVTNLNKKTQYNMLLGAVRLRADIADRVIATGQTLGVIEKEPEKKMIVGGISVSELPDKDLKKGVVKAVAGFAKLLEKYGEGQNLRELQPGQLHYGEAVEVKEKMADDDTAALGAPPMKEEQKGKRNRAKSSKRSAGRRKDRGK